MIRRIPIITFIAGALLLAAFRLGQATATETPNGLWWRDLSPAERVRVVQGTSDAYKAGFGTGSASAHRRAYEELTRQDVDVQDHFFVGPLQGLRARWQRLSRDASEREARPRGSSKFPAFTDTAGTYVDQITNYYINNPERTGVTIGFLMACYSSVQPTNCKLISIGR